MFSRTLSRVWCQPSRRLCNSPLPSLPFPIWLSSLRPLVVSHGDEAAALLTSGSRLVRRFEDSGDVRLGDAAVVRSLAELASDMCLSVTTLGLLHRLAIHLDPAALGGPPCHRAFECRILVRDSGQSLTSDRAAEDLTALGLVVFTTIILVGLDEDPDAVLPTGEPSRLPQPTSSSLPLTPIPRVST